MKSVEIFIKKENKVYISKEWVSIAWFLSQGFEVREIAAKLKINRRTLEGRIVVIKSKLDCKTLSHLVAFFLRQKLIR